MQSVASFFISRVDAEVDKRLRATGHDELCGIAALANARTAYRRFEDIFRGERFETLRAAGATVQRPLWASTGVKDPTYPDTMYVDGLVGPDTVNTMPRATLRACSQRLDVTGDTIRNDSAPELEALAAAGIDLHDVTDKLLRDGVDAFVAPMRVLLASIDIVRTLAADSTAMGVREHYREAT